MKTLQLKILASLATTSTSPSSYTVRRERSERKEKLTGSRNQAKSLVDKVGRVPDILEQSSENKDKGPHGGAENLNSAMEEVQPDAVVYIGKSCSNGYREEGSMKWPVASAEELTLALKEKLTRCLRLKSFNRWSRYEWFYAAVDRDFFCPPAKPFPAFLKSLNLPKVI